MSIPAWPTELPQLVDEESYQGTAGDNVLRTQMDVGPPKQRLHTRVSGREVTLAVYLDQSEYKEHFLPFWKEAIAEGALNFEWSDPATEETAEIRVTGPYREIAEEGYLLVEIPGEIVP